MRPEEVTALTDPCLHGEPAPCATACPFGLDIRDFLDRAAKGRWNLAYKRLSGDVPFPVIVAALCPQPCAARCPRDEPIAVRDIEAACTRLATQTDPPVYRVPPKPGRIAVVGAGLAGLAVALNMARKGYPVTIYEREADCLSRFRTHPLVTAFRADVTRRFSAVAAEFRYLTPVRTLDELAEYTAVCVTSGAEGETFGLPVPASGFGPANAPAGEPGARERPGVFFGGARAGRSDMEALADGVALSKHMETYLQLGHCETGERRRTDAGAPPFPPPEDANDAPRVIPASETAGYTEEEARAEAARCALCDCRRCMDVCEMLNRFGKRPQKIASEAYTDTMANPPYSVCTLTRQTYSCNLCGRCRAACPVGVDMGEVFRRARAGRAGLPNTPLAFHDFWLRDMAFSTSDEAAYRARPRDEGEPRFVFFPGCKLGAAAPARVSATARRLLETAGAGVWTDCCGAPALWAGDETAFAARRESLTADWEALGRPCLLLACPYCGRVFREHLPHIPTRSLYTFLVENDIDLPQTVTNPAPTAAPRRHVFDPCAADPRIAAHVRTLATRAGASVTDTPPDFRCCGFGGHMREANPDLCDAVLDTSATRSPAPYLVYCANCAEAFTSVGKDNIHILDAVFGLDPPAPALPDIRTKRDNARALRRALLSLYENRTPEPPPEPADDPPIRIDEAALREADRRLISADDIREAVRAAESGGPKFVAADGLISCRLSRPVFTYWVTYKKVSGVFRVFSAYCHKMRYND